MFSVTVSCCLIKAKRQKANSDKKKSPKMWLVPLTLQDIATVKYENLSIIHKVPGTSQVFSPH